MRLLWSAGLSVFPIIGRITEFFAVTNVSNNCISYWQNKNLFLLCAFCETRLATLERGRHLFNKIFEMQANIKILYSTSAQQEEHSHFLGDLLTRNSVMILRPLCSGMWCRVVWYKCTAFSQKHSAFFVYPDDNTSHKAEIFTRYCKFLSCNTRKTEELKETGRQATDRHFNVLFQQPSGRSEEHHDKTWNLRYNTTTKPRIFLSLQPQLWLSISLFNNSAPSKRSYSSWLKWQILYHIIRQTARFTCTFA